MHAFKNNIEIPEIFKYTGSIMDFRRKMQTYGGYAERRSVLDETIYNLCDMVEKTNIKNNQSTSTRINIEKKDVIQELKLSKEIKTKYGNIKFDSLNIKDGGNSIVLFGMLQNENVAVKILISNSQNKLNRFLCEFANVVIKLNDLENIARLYFYDTVSIGSNVLDVIVMKRYSKTLKYDENYSEEEIIRIFKQIIDCMEKVHDRGIIHRDLKPQNILLDEKMNVVITDLGIAYYNPEIFELTGHTTSSERLANFDFSAPEQRNSKLAPKATMDIYAIGQIVQWLVFGESHKGTNRKRLTEKFNTKRMNLLDNIVEKCLDNNPAERYQNIKEIKLVISEYNNSTSKSVININNTMVDDIDKEEIKEKLIDILENICGTDKEHKAFYSYNKLSDSQTERFLDNLEIKLNKLQFFNSIGISKVIEEGFYDSFLVEKKYYEELNKLYKQVNESIPNLRASFIEYVKLSINENVEELPF